MPRRSIAPAPTRHTDLARFLRARIREAATCRDTTLISECIAQFGCSEIDVERAISELECDKSIIRQRTFIGSRLTWDNGGTPIGKTRPKAFKRLKLKQQNHGNDLAILDGEEYRLPAGGLELLKTLQTAANGGESVMSTDFPGIRPERVYAKLDPKLQAILDKPGRGRQGYRML